MGTHDVVLDKSAEKKRDKKSKKKKTASEPDTPSIGNTAQEDFADGHQHTALDASAKKKQKTKSKKKDRETELDAPVQENMDDEDCENSVALEASAEKKRKKKTKKKRKEPEPDASVTEDIAYGKEEDAYGTQIDDNEPTMADKLASLDLGKNDDIEIQERQEPLAAQPPSADSVHVLLKQALHADDHALLLDCLYNQDDKVIANSVSLLNPADIFKLLDSLMSIIQSRGAVLVCALPWLRSLLLQHSSRIMSHESSLVALNSLYQLIESRVATLNPTIQLASSLDILFAGVDDDGLDEYESAPPVIYEDNDDSDQEESGEDDAMETDEETKEPEEFSGLSDIDGSEGFSD